MCFSCPVYLTHSPDLARRFPVSLSCLVLAVPTRKCWPRAEFLIFCCHTEWFLFERRNRASWGEVSPISRRNRASCGEVSPILRRNRASCGEVSPILRGEIEPVVAKCLF